MWLVPSSLTWDMVLPPKANASLSVDRLFVFLGFSPCGCCRAAPRRPPAPHGQTAGAPAAPRASHRARSRAGSPALGRSGAGCWCAPAAPPLCPTRPCSRDSVRPPPLRLEGREAEALEHELLRSFFYILVCVGTWTRWDLDPGRSSPWCSAAWCLASVAALGKNLKQTSHWIRVLSCRVWLANTSGWLVLLWYHKPESCCDNKSNI